ncbi:MAG: acyltransferase family protein, partial [Bacilli bacterium]|nr:acyltransferase family protein [Bacilli bacterium]
TTNYYADIFAGNANMVPSVIKYIIFSLIGIGPLWYAHVLFVASLLIVLIRKIDNKNVLDDLFSKINLPILFLLFLLVWGSSFILNTPVITVYRWGIYLLMFILGYYIFSSDKIIKKLESVSILLGITTLIVGIIFTIVNYGTNFGSNEFLTNIFTNIYIWLVILSAFGLGKKYLDFENKFTNYMNKNNFSFYVLHYSIQIVIAFILVEYIKLNNFIFNYIILIIGTIIVLPLITEFLKRIPIVNRLLLGIVNQQKSSKN